MFERQENGDVGEAWLGWAGWVIEKNGMFIGGTLLSRLTNHTSPTTNVWTRIGIFTPKVDSKIFQLSCHIVRFHCFCLCSCATSIIFFLWQEFGIWIHERETTFKNRNRLLSYKKLKESEQIITVGKDKKNVLIQKKILNFFYAKRKKLLIFLKIFYIFHKNYIKFFLKLSINK